MDIWTLIVINRGVYLRKKLPSDIVLHSVCEWCGRVYSSIISL